MSRFILRRSLLLVFACTALPCTAQSEHVAGPLVGDVRPTSARLWMYVPTGAGCSVRYGPDDGTGETVSLPLTPHPDPVSRQPGQPATVTLAGLTSDTRYRYQVSVAGQSDPAWAGSFRTAPPDGRPSKFRLAVTSCMKTGQPQASWYLLLAQQPDLHLTLGDTHYADTTDPTVQLRHHVSYRREPFFGTVIRNVPTYAMWDDHDYGPNNSDGTAAGKEQSLRGWRQFWVNPGAGTAEVPGAFYRFTWGEVEFFVVDGRYHRSPDEAPDDEHKRMLGDGQFAWLLDGLRSSRARFKVIASGSTLDHSQGDGWKIYTHSRHRLFDRIREHEINGVLYLSGDIHRSLVWEHPESERVGYPLVEVISSGVANSKTLSFATLDFDTTVEDPSVRVRIVHGDGTVRDDRSWTLSRLSSR